MADWVRVEMSVEYPLTGDPDSYGGETDPDKQVLLEKQWIEEDGDYLLSLMSDLGPRTHVSSVTRVWRRGD